MAGAFERWLFSPAPAQRLAALRILVGTFMVGYVLVRLPAFTALADEPARRLEPVGVLSGLRGPLPDALLHGLLATALLTGVGFVAGWHFRWTGPGFASLTLLLTTYRSSWGQLLWFEMLPVLHLLVIGFAPSADAWSLDRTRSGHRTRPADWGWPVRLAAMITVATYALAGIAKLRIGGLPWVLGDTLTNHVAYSATRLDVLGGSPSPLAEPFMRNRWMARPFATASLVLELAAPFVLVRRSLLLPWIAGIWLMHVGIAALMFVVFPYPLTLIAFAPLVRLERFSRPGIPGGPS